MPSGRTHDKINLHTLFAVSLLFVMVSSYFLFSYQGFFISLYSVIGFSFGTYCFGPDLDIRSRPFFRWRMFRFIWIPYQKFFSHRSFWTHSYLIGDIIRIIYLFCYLSILLLIGSFVFFLFNQNFNLIDFFLDNFQKLFFYFEKFNFYFFCFFIGIVISSSLHIFSDHVSTFRKNIRRRYKK